MPITVDTTFFFDSEKLTKMLDRKTRRALSRAGGYIRTTAKRSIKKRQGTSKPGDPPYSHTGLLKNFIFYRYDPHTKSVTIGPEKLNRSDGDGPKALEYGGTAQGYKRPALKLGDFGILRIDGTTNRGGAGLVKGTVRAWGKTYIVQYGRIRTDSQLRLARENEKKIYGDGRNVNIAARPFMRPALGEAMKNLNTFFN